ncbi:hypothetical protein TWF506_001874 [Arthrobotrys conoides]|uniref:Uncharacterized protein n=1 Tax=Arthrobotrys conoides TaxID=74498 RepID=A0AAN8NPA6_9PEZI
MSQKSNSDLLDFGQDIKRMSADNITPPDTASRPREESTTATTAEKPVEESRTTVRSAGSSSIDSEEAAAASRWGKDKSDGKE